MLESEPSSHALSSVHCRCSRPYVLLSQLRTLHPDPVAVPVHTYFCHSSEHCIQILSLFPSIRTSVTAQNIASRSCRCSRPYVLLSQLRTLHPDPVAVPVHTYFCHSSEHCIQILSLFPSIRTSVTARNIASRSCRCSRPYVLLSQLRTLHPDPVAVPVHTYFCHSSQHCIQILLL